MDYNKKYLKYKKKYLDLYLKGVFSNRYTNYKDLTLVFGPVYIKIVKICTSKIFFFSDIHDDNVEINGVHIVKYIKNILNIVKNKNLIFFLEKSILNLPKDPNTIESDSIEKLREEFALCEHKLKCEFENTKIKSVDLRISKYGKDKHVKLPSLILFILFYINKEKLKNFTELYNYTKKFKNINDLLRFILGFDSRSYEFIFNFKFTNKIITSLGFKEVMNISIDTPNIENFFDSDINRFVIKQQQMLNKYTSKNYQKIFIKKVINRIDTEIPYILSGCYIMDNYFLLNLLSNLENKIILVYLGSAHIEFCLEVLNELSNINLITEYEYGVLKPEYNDDKHVLVPTNKYLKHLIE